MELSQTLSDALGAELDACARGRILKPAKRGATLALRSGDLPATYRAGALERGAFLSQESVSPPLAGGARGRVELGDPVSRLLHVATDESASLLVLGWRARRFFGRRSIGRLLRGSPCPVVLVPLGSPRRVMPPETPRVRGSR